MYTLELTEVIQLDHIDISYIDISHIDVSRIDISHIDISYIDINHVDISHIDISLRRLTDGTVCKHDVVDYNYAVVTDINVNSLRY